MPRARTAIGVTADGATLVRFTVDPAGQSLGMSVTEVAGLLIRAYPKIADGHFFNAGKGGD